MCIAGVLASEA